MEKLGGRWGRVPSIDVTKDFDTVMLVLLRGAYEPYQIWEAPRDKVLERLSRPGSKARNERGSMDVTQFLSIAAPIWPSPSDET